MGHQRGFYARGEYMADLSDAAIEVFLAHAADLVTLSPPFSQMIIFRIGQGVSAVRASPPRFPTATPGTSSIRSPPGWTPPTARR